MGLDWSDRGKGRVSQKQTPPHAGQRVTTAWDRLCGWPNGKESLLPYTAMAQGVRLLIQPGN